MQTFTLTLFLAVFLTNGWAVSCLWMVTKQQIFNFISMQLHVHSGRTNRFYAISMSQYHFGSNFSRPS